MAEMPALPTPRSLSISEIANAVKDDALYVFGGDACAQETRDAIEYCYPAFCAIDARTDFWRKTHETELSTP